MFNPSVLSMCVRWYSDVLDSELAHVGVPFLRREFPPVVAAKGLDLGTELTFNQCNVRLDCRESVGFLLEEGKVNLPRVVVITGQEVARTANGSDSGGSPKVDVDECHGATPTNNGPVASDSKDSREVHVFGENRLSYFVDSQNWLKDLCGS